MPMYFSMKDVQKAIVLWAFETTLKSAYNNDNNQNNKNSNTDDNNNDNDNNESFISCSNVHEIVTHRSCVECYILNSR